MDKENGKAAVIHNGSPLFTGDAGSGPSNIRKYILEHDLLDAIIALPNDFFTTQELQLISGFSTTENQQNARTRFNS